MDTNEECNFRECARYLQCYAQANSGHAVSWEREYGGRCGCVGEYVPDLIADDKIVVDTKVIDKITDHEVGQMMNYLKITSLRVGLILNFRRAQLEWKRIIL